MSDMDDSPIITGAVYRMTCAVTGKVYIGITRRAVKKRIAEHFDNASRYTGGYRHLYNAIRKHPREFWTIETLGTADSWELLCAMEIEQIALHQSKERAFGYNATDGGDGNRGFEYTPEMREAARARATGRKTSEATKHKLRELHRNPEYAARVTAALRAHKHGPDHYAKISQLLKGRERTADHRAKISAALTGKPKSPEHIAKSAAARTGYRKTPDQIEASARFHRGRKRSDETREKLRRQMYRRIAEGWRPPPSTDFERDAAIARAYSITGLPFDKVAPQFGIKASAANQAVMRVRHRVREYLAAANRIYENAPLPPGRMHPDFIEFSL